MAGIGIPALQHIKRLRPIVTEGGLAPTRSQHTALPLQPLRQFPAQPDGSKNGRALQAGCDPLGRRFAGGIRRALRPDGGGRHVHQAEPEALAGLLLRPLRSERCGARRRPHLHLQQLSKEAAGPTNNWVNPFEMRKKLRKLFNGCMKGRTMYVLPFSMGPDRFADVADRRAAHRLAYVVVNMRIMARIGKKVFEKIDKGRSASCPACTRSARR
jgi:hypothetical protein